MPSQPEPKPLCHSSLSLRQCHSPLKSYSVSVIIPTNTGLLAVCEFGFDPKIENTTSPGVEAAIKALGEYPGSGVYSELILFEIDMDAGIVVNQKYVAPPNDLDFISGGWGWEDFVASAPNELTLFTCNGRPWRIDTKNGTIAQPPFERFTMNGSGTGFVSQDKKLTGFVSSWATETRQLQLVLWNDNSLILSNRNSQLPVCQNEGLAEKLRAAHAVFLDSRWILIWDQCMVGIVSIDDPTLRVAELDLGLNQERKLVTCLIAEKNIHIVASNRDYPQNNLLYHRHAELQGGSLAFITDWSLLDSTP